MTTLPLIRQVLTDALREPLGDTFRLFPDPVTQSDVIAKPTVVLERTKVEKMPEAPLAYFQNSLTLYVISPKANDEDYLDGLLDDVLEALDEQANVLWDSADRAIYKDQYPAYAITISATSNRKA